MYYVFFLCAEIPARAVPSPSRRHACGAAHPTYPRRKPLPLPPSPSPAPTHSQTHWHASADFVSKGIDGKGGQSGGGVGSAPKPAWAQRGQKRRRRRALLRGVGEGGEGEGGGGRGSSTGVTPGASLPNADGEGGAQDRYNPATKPCLEFSSKGTCGRGVKFVTHPFPMVHPSLRVSALTFFARGGVRRGRLAGSSTHWKPQREGKGGGRKRKEREREEAASKAMPGVLQRGTCQRGG